MILIFGALVFFLSQKTIRYYKKAREYKGESTGKLYQFITGIDKIRMAGAEERAIFEFLQPVTNEKKEAIKANHIGSASSVLISSGATIFSMILYFMMVKRNIGLSIGSFIAFNTAFGSFTGSIMGLVGALSEYMQTKPIIQRIKPIFDTAVEDDDEKDSIDELKGDIIVDRVTFGYSKDTQVLKDFSIHIYPGEYVAIVGPSGCGKSTLLKLLLGFEKPDQGTVFYDGKDLSSINKHLLRKKIGVVLQNGCLIAGSIYDNITITGENPNIKDVNAVIEDVGLKQDIDAMPMGVHTMMNESGGTISGGQLQRILIARAIYNNPSILFFDEATSALDNITQAKVCNSLEKRHITRLVIAHRLSTVQNCDRIIVVDKGKVIEEGNYQKLMNDKGMFYQMAIRQLAE